MRTDTVIGFVIMFAIVVGGVLFADWLKTQKRPF